MTLKHFVPVPYHFTTKPHVYALQQSDLSFTTPGTRELCSSYCNYRYSKCYINKWQY